MAAVLAFVQYICLTLNSILIFLKWVRDTPARERKHAAPAWDSRGYGLSMGMRTWYFFLGFPLLSYQDTGCPLSFVDLIQMLCS